MAAKSRQNSRQTRNARRAGSRAVSSRAGARSRASSGAAGGGDEHGGGFYDHPAWYDLLHLAGTSEEIDHLETINHEFGRGGDRWLEPACGAGRYLRVLARRGVRATGYDINERATEFARGRLARSGLRAEVILADMTTFVRERSFDFAFNTINTFRHLMTDRSALAHLRVTAKSLKPDGLYVVGVDLADYDLPIPEEEVWTARRGRLSIKHLMIADPPARPLRRERIINHITVSTPSQRREFQFAYNLRSYDFDEWNALIAKSPFEIAATFSFAWKPMRFGYGARDVNFVLRRAD